MSAATFVIVASLTACLGGSAPAPTPATEPVEATSEAIVNPTKSVSEPPPASPSEDPTNEVMRAPTALVSSCVLADDAYMDIDEFEEAIACAVTYFPWPAHYVPDLQSINQALSKNEPTRYQDGFEFIFLSGWNQCAWYDAWLDARKNGDATAEAEALDTMINVVPNHATVIPNFPSGIDPSTVDYRREIAAKAALGDPSLVQDWVTHNCYFTVWTTGS